MRVPLEYIHFYVKVPKTEKKVFGQVTFLGKGILCGVDFKNINLPL
jgi:hypothetical protein